MAYNDNQNESPLPTPGNDKRTASDLIPKFFKTEANRKFLQGTIDQLIQPGVAEKLSGFVGRKTAKARKADDNYIGDVSADRENYQFEPAAVIKDTLDNVTFYKDYNDYLGSLRFFGANTDNHDRLNSQEYYAWDPHIDWDKFVNFREYYWLPNGPLSIPLRGQQREIVSTYTVTTVTEDDNTAYVFNDGFTRNPTLKLYRGQTYRFEIDTPGHPIAFSISRTFTPGTAILTAGSEGLRANGLFDGVLYGNEYDQGDFIILPSSGSVFFEADDNVSTLYPDGIRKLGEDGEEVATVYVERGTIEFTIPADSPERLYYISKNSIDTSGLLRIYDVEENTFLDVEADILGKKTYRNADGIELSNGMKLQFTGDVTPAEYNQNQWYVEGVGDKICLIKDVDLIIPAAYSENRLIPFDSDQFDVLPFANASSFPAEKDYLVINRAARDRNAWSRYNRWFHRSVVETSFLRNDLPVNIDEETRAKRPIIEFEAGLKLYNFGTEAKRDVDLVDTFTQDVFSTIEGQLGYNVDGVDIADGMRVLFIADTDILVRGKIYQVNFIEIGNNRQISLVETADTDPLENETVFVTQGNRYTGQTFFYNGTDWQIAQEKTQRNQPPLFDLCCPQGNEFADTDVFDSATFRGTKIFSYRQDTGSTDPELDFALTYRNIENSGDILFDFNLLTDSFTVQTDSGVETVTTDTANLRRYRTRTDFAWVNGWSSVPALSKQYVVTQYIADDLTVNSFEVDVYDRAGDLNDLKVIVQVNNSLKVRLQDYEIDRINSRAFVRFYQDLNEGDVVVIKTRSTTVKNVNGYYEFPHNLERNPLNQDVTEFTLGEVIDHVSSMVEELNQFSGVFPGTSNIRDLGDIDRYGKKFVKHTGPINLPLYHLTTKDYNIVKALRYSRDEYAKFKRVFLETAETLGFDGETRIHVDRVLAEMNKDKIKSQPFYFSDMIGYGPFNRIEYEVLDPRSTFYALSRTFSLSDPSARSALIYLNGRQLTHNRDYTFNTDGYALISADQREGDTIEIVEYATTDGGFVAPTPSKLGLYPKYEPELTIDDTFQTDEPASEGPYKIYGSIVDGHPLLGARGWFYPVYTSRSAARAADTALGGTGTIESLQFKGLNRTLYMAASAENTRGGQDNIEIDAYPVGIPFVRGHDGSYIRAYLDYRDELLLELEKRIFNNIKVEWSEDITDVYGFAGGDFRSSEFTRTELNRSLLTEFTQWLKLVDNDYTDNFFYDRLNEFTFNYSNANNPQGELAPGFWRGVYKRAYDTDRPHSHPWEMLGFTIKPTWWNTVYGPAPYTSDNLILWRDLEQGIVREPGKEIQVKDKFVRAGLANFIPADNQGNLKSPLRSGYVKNFVLRLSTGNFNFGDEAPVETAWRRSSQYPFALITSMLLNKPAQTMGAGFDVSRISRNLAGQKVYQQSSKPISNTDIVFPNTFADDERILTAGFVNYIYNLVASDVLAVYSDYQTQLTTLINQLGFKLAGFSDTQKLNLILESRSPSANFEGGIFVPQENYQIFFNTSSPIELAVYSGVAVEKVANGFIVRGYNNDAPFFDYYAPQAGTSSTAVTVGGISETAAEWENDKRYQEGQVVQFNNTFYRATATFTSGDTFNTDNLARLPALPIVGGKTAEFKKNFESRKPLSIPYGTVLRTSQDVVDFLLGYGARLNDLGFDFNFVESEGRVNNWNAAAREFLFWTTQGWASGTVITLSPAANRFFFQREFVVVDDIYDDFYNYSLLQSDGQSLPREFGSLLRDENSFGLEIVSTDEGLYSIALPLVQKEHVVLVNNRTIFNDVLYQPSTGYRRDRIKVAGYRSDGWNGGLNIPGFVFDDAKTTEWTQWKDYAIGSLVKYKQFFYVATENAPGTKDFNSNFWFRLNEKPEAELITNFDYRINQFADFYDLDTDGFDAELQKMAQHLTGYQKRQYLANIINDDVSQYKFYQGMIQDKGTKNALDKMFVKLSSAGEESLEFFEEWALQVGRYGAVDNIQQIEINLKQDKIQESPQSVELVNSIPAVNFDKIYRILPFEMYDRPADYDHTPFPTKPLVDEYIRSAGYVNEEDVTFIAGTTDELNTGDVNQLGLGEYVWVTEVNATPWDVYQHVSTNANVIELEDRQELNSEGIPLRSLYLDKWAKDHVQAGDLVGVRSAQEFNINSIYKVDSVSLEEVKIQVPEDNEIVPFATQSYILTKLRSVRVDDLDELAQLAQEKLYNQQRVWVDNYNGDWSVLENDPVYVNRQTLVNLSEFDSTVQDFGTNIAATPDNNNLFVAAPGDGNGKIFYYRRTKETFNFNIDQELVLDDGDLFTVSDGGFASSLDVTEDGEYLVVGLPTASGVNTRFKGDFDADAAYNKNDIVKDRDSLWKANREILPQITTQPFSTFDNYINIASSADADSTSLTLLVAGDPGLEGNTVDHLLVRAPRDMYLGTKAGDVVNLFWNRRSFAYPTLDVFLPFDGEIPQITPEFLQQDHEIIEKIDHVFFIETFITLPGVGDTVTTDTGQAEVAYVGTRRDSTVLYLKDTNGTFDITGELFIEDVDFVGFYTEENTFSTTDAVAGFWYIETPSYSNNGRYYDIGRGLVYADIRLQDSNRSLNSYYNIQDTIVTIGNYVLNRNRVSVITQLSYRGDPAGADGVNGTEQQIPSDLWVVRAGKLFTDTLSTGDSFEFRVYDLDNRDLTDALETAGITGNYSVTNKTQTIYDLWDGYIDFEFTRFDFGGFPFEPQVGDIIEDVQTPRDGAGGLALTTTTTSSAEIMYMKRNFNSVRVYVKVLSGSWLQQNNIGRYEIRRNANNIIRGPGDVDRVIGTVNDPGNDIAVGTNEVGKLIVFEHSSDFNDTRAWNEIPPVVDEEYFFFNEIIEQGVQRLPNPPFSLNKDYTQVYHISADEFGTAGPNGEGAVAIFRKLPDGRYRFQKLFVSEYRTANRGFGKSVKIKQVDNYYTLFVSSNSVVLPGDDSTERREHPGSIEIFRHGVKPTDRFRGEYQITAYSEGDIVIYRDDYYVALKNMSETENRIQDPIYWNNISWRRGKDTDYRGDWDNSYGYAVGSIVRFNNKFYRATTNIAANEPFSTTVWAEITDLIDYVGYLPNLTDIASYDEAVFDPVTNIAQFSNAYDVSGDAQVIVVTAELVDASSTSETKVLIYRETDDKYLLDQIIDAPQLQNTINWARKITINPAGTQFAISAPLDDTAKTDQGQVYVYTQVDGEFVLSQTLTPPNNEESEQFGYDISFGEDNLAVSSLNGDQRIPTTFDNGDVTFDNGFTNFRNIKLDTGVVYIFEELNDRLVYSEQFRYDTAQSEFGEILLANANHVYVGVPSHSAGDSSKGIVVDYRKPKGVTAWNTLRSSVTPVDVSRIEGVFLYNKRTNQIVSYVDYVDPIQGKIPGIVEQELTYKIGFDPAAYNVGDLTDLTVDPSRYWAGEHVGQTWWNINTARFSFAYQGTTAFQKNEWNKLMPDATIDIYEWVESEYLPSQWNQLADTDEGIELGVSGTAPYVNSKYSARLTYDDIAQIFSTKYYYWVQNKRTIPSTRDRSISTFEMANLVARPREQGYRFVSFLSENKFVLNNFDNLVTSDDLVLNIRYNVGSQKLQNTHAQYRLMSDGLDRSRPDADIERKWFDSLIGVDTNNRPVPDPNIPIAKRYGIQNRPRQGMFVNRIEALKQTIERANLVLAENLVVDQYDIDRLFEKEPTPSTATKLYDLAVDTYSELRFVSTNKVTPARLSPVILNGRLIRVDIVDSGRGYKTAPSVDIVGTGVNADVELTINNLGQVVSAEVVNDGSGYNESTLVNTRRFSVLVNSDETLNGKWALYSWNDTANTWFRSSLQDFDVSIYWNYADWYASSFNQFTNIDYEIEGAYLLTSLDDLVGDIVKINNVGTGGWLLLEKVANEDTEDYTINYKTIGRQNGTVQFSDSLYDFSKNTVGFDNRSFDSWFYDNNPAKELRIILETLRDDILVTDLAVEYNQLFFASLRYILSEQQRVDWMFKSSFVNVKHNLGELEQKINFENNKLPSFEAYVEEVKPYSTKIREFISSYTSLDSTNSSVTDFDNAPYYDRLTKRIEASRAVIQDGVLVGANVLSESYPRKHWADNIGYSIKEIQIANPGSGYTSEPRIRFESSEGTGATAKAYLGYGRITEIKITNPGSGYITTPRVVIEGPQTDDGVVAAASAILGNGLVRTPSIRIKFDRTAGVYTFEDLAETETFSGTNINTVFNLEWPMDLDNRKVKISVNGVEQLRSQYTYSNVDYIPTAETLAKEFNYGDVNSAAGPGTQKITDGYSYQKGRITFTRPPANEATITVGYYRPLSMLSAEDRIKFAYTPVAGMLGNDLAQLMSGVDYGGVEVRGFDFGGPSGWDSQGWYTDTWDTFDNTFEDEVFIADGSTIAVELTNVLENGIVYNIYKNGVRLDDPDYDLGTPVNPTAITNSITGDGVTKIIDLDDRGISLLDGDILIVRKITSDGSVIPDPLSYDVALSGGDLSYQTAKGLNPEEIIVDGDGFVTPTTSSGPEELVPGQVLDTLDIKVYTRESGGQGTIYSQSYIMDASITQYALGTTPGNADSVFVKLDNEILADDEYTIDWTDNTVTILNPVDGVELNILTMGLGTQDIMDYGFFTSVEGQTDYKTSVEWVDTASVYVTVDGEAETVTLFEDDNRATFRFDTPTTADKTIYWVIFNTNTEINYSQVSKDTFVANGTDTQFELLSAPFYALPNEHNILVKVGNTILNAGYNKQFTISQLSEREFALETFQQPVGSLGVEDVSVFLNGVEIVSPVQWRLEIANSSIILADEVGAPGDFVEVYVITDGDYRISNKTVILNTAPTNSTTVEIYQFSNHNVLGIERINYDVVARTTLIPEDVQYVTYNRLTVGEIALRTPAVDAEYVWVAVNGELLTPSVDYYVTDDRTKVRLVRLPAANDVIDIIHFTMPVNAPRFAYRQFKDMLNRTHFKRLDTATTALAQPLNYYDLRIEVVDGTDLAEPNKGGNLPGIVWINSERIEYFVKEGNTLRQLRRGTLGTGTPVVHPAAEKLFDQNASKTVPYKDQTLVYNEQTTDNDIIKVTNTFVPGFTITDNNIEVFSSGTRLRKTSLDVFNPTIALDSPKGDTIALKEFGVDPINEFIEKNNSYTIIDTEKYQLDPMLDTRTYKDDSGIIQPTIYTISAAGGSGLFAKFDVTLTNGVVSVSRATNRGFNYKVGDILTILVSELYTSAQIAARNIQDIQLEVTDVYLDENGNSTALGTSTIPANETRITVVKKIGQTWTRLGESLSTAENSIARFLRAGTTELPE